MMNAISNIFSRKIITSTKHITFLRLHICSRRHKICELTSERYAIKRKPFKIITNNDKNFFRNFLGASQIITDVDELKSYNLDWFNTYKGASKLLLKPKSTEEVSKILKYCNKNRLAVCVQGGNTGVVGGAVPVFDEIILSTMLMNQIETVDEWSGAVVCEAGCILEVLDRYVSQYGLMVPLDLGAKSSCHIGGNISTNAGGLRFIKYGSLHGTVLGLEVVLASGEILDCLSCMKKDNTGYDLKHLFIGSEGTLGIVTKVAIHCPTRLLTRNVAFLGLNSFADCLRTIKQAKIHLAEILSACEFTDHISLEALEENKHITLPFEKYPFYIFLETTGSHEGHDSEKINAFVESELESGLVRNGIVAANGAQMQSLWKMREDLAAAILLDGYLYTYDISLPLEVSYDIVQLFQGRLENKVVRCSGFGHLGDGNIHLCIGTKEFDQEVLNLVEPYVYEVVEKYKGSISAEHGMGVAKKGYMSYSKSKNTIGLMQKLKSVMDPNGILNPYKVLPSAAV